MVGATRAFIAAVMSGELFVYNGGQVLSVSARRLVAEVLRACRVADFNFLGFVAGFKPELLREAEDPCGAAGSHHAARAGKLSVLR